MSEKILVIGEDGLIGSELMKLLRANDLNVIGTTRNKSLADNINTIYLDLSSDDFSIFTPLKFTAAFFCAGITSIAECEDNSLYTKKINVTNTVKLATKLILNGARIIYLSSSAVFEGNKAWPNESDLCAPSCEYGRQKLSVETQLLAISTPDLPVTVVRLTKILPQSGGLLSDIFSNSNLNLETTTFKDLYMCPISMNYAVTAIYIIFRGAIQGIFHVSGERELSYSDLVLDLAERVGFNKSMIRISTIEKSQKRSIFRPAHPGLGMSDTNQLLGLRSETYDDLMSLLVTSYKSLRSE